MVRFAAGDAEDGDEDRQGHYRRPYPFPLLHGVDLTEEVALHFHNWVLLCWFVFSVSTNGMFANGFPAAVAWWVRAGYPQQQPDFSSGFVPEGAERNFCRQSSLQK